MRSTQDAEFNLADFGAIGNGLADDGPALQRALDALAEAGGGTLFVPAGRYALDTPVQKDFSGLAASITIKGVESLTPAPPPSATGEILTRGLDLVSEFAPRTGTQAVAIHLTGLQFLLLKDITFIGTPDVETDALITVALFDITNATINHCEFYGLGSTVDGGAIVQSTRSDLKIEQSVFLGSATSSGVYSSVVQNFDWKGVTIVDTVFVDYGQRPELYGKLGIATPYSWVNMGDAFPLTTSSPRREAVFRNVFFDEGGLNGLSVVPATPSAGAPFHLLYITGLYMNVSNLNAAGNYIDGPQATLIEDAHYGWSHIADSAITLLGVGNAILDQVECKDGVNRIRADDATAKLTVINSQCENVDSAAPATRIITTDTPEEDPVQYVRQQFISLLGREPDPAAHFYWSNLLLECVDNASGAANQRSVLASYLTSSPNANFSISGQVTDEIGSGLSGANVSLGGSQTIATQTDSTGNYTFQNLPTSGSYEVTASLTGFTFSPGQTITSASGDQIVNFVGESPARFEFEAATYSVNEGARLITINVMRTGNCSHEAEVTYSGTDGTADQKSDVIPVVGRLIFAAGETSKSFVVFVTDDAHVEGDESMTIHLSDPAGATLGNSVASLDIVDNDTNNTATNPIDDAQFFVRQHYRDFLNRAADDDGLAFWSNQISNCGNDAACLTDRRMNVSAAFFLSIEFQETGFLVYRLYKASFAESPEHLGEFLLDTRTIGQGLVVNAPGWQEVLEANKVSFIENFVRRPRFTAEYPLILSPTEFVEQLNNQAGGTLTSEAVATAVAEFGSNETSADTEARARVLRRVAESELLTKRELNPAFVMMEYFGYLQRNPDDPPNTNLDGYNFWLNKLNEFDGDFRRAEMVKSFLVSGEYRERFGNP